LANPPSWSNRQHTPHHFESHPLANSASYDVVNDFEPIGLLAESPMLLIVKKVIPANNLGEFIAWLKANSDKSSIGTAGAGSPPHLLGLLLRAQTGT
jgi:tripartite-type tricarboxylate transporter receptor subunit TctC